MQRRSHAGTTAGARGVSGAAADGGRPAHGDLLRAPCGGGSPSGDIPPECRRAAQSRRFGPRRRRSDTHPCLQQSHDARAPDGRTSRSGTPTSGATTAPAGHSAGQYRGVRPHVVRRRDRTTDPSAPGAPRRESCLGGPELGQCICCPSRIGRSGRHSGTALPERSYLRSMPHKRLCVTTVRPAVALILGREPSGPTLLELRYGATSEP
jgi:hypothetical protein